jgi:hypothetical protein
MTLIFGMMLLMNKSYDTVMKVVCWRRLIPNLLALWPSPAALIQFPRVGIVPQTLDSRQYKKRAIDHV